MTLVFDQGNYQVLTILLFQLFCTIIIHRALVVNCSQNNTDQVTIVCTVVNRKN